MVSDPARPLLRVHQQAPWLIADLGAPCQAISWAPVRPGPCVARRVVWLEVRNRDLPPDTDATKLLARRMDQAGFAGAIGLMTSSPLADHVVTAAEVKDGGTPVRAEVALTLGLSNGERVGERAARPPQVGTINLVCRVSVPLTPGALLEALSVATQARTAGVIALAVPRDGTGPTVTGTGTDCVVMAAPITTLAGETGTSAAAAYAGTHTALGEAIGAAVLQAVQRAAIAWRARSPI